MKWYEVEITEKMVSTVQVEAETEDEAYDLAMEELRNVFFCPIS